MVGSVMIHPGTQGVGLSKEISAAMCWCVVLWYNSIESNPRGPRWGKVYCWMYHWKCLWQ